MLYVCAERFDVTGNLEKILVFDMNNGGGEKFLGTVTLLFIFNNYCSTKHL